MSENFVNLFTTQFTAQTAMLLQQKTSMLRGKVMEGGHVGKQASPVNQISAVQVTGVEGRFQPMDRQDPTFVRRWVVPQDQELKPILFDSLDALKSIVDPKSGYAEAAAAAFSRKWDDVIIQAAHATAYTGTDSASTSESWSTSYDIADTFGSGASDGLTIAKMIEARRLFRHAHVEIESDPLTLVIGSTQEADLLNQAQLQSGDFNKNYGAVMSEGKISRLYGFDLVVSERLNYASNIRNCIAFAKSGMYLGVWQDVNYDISKRNDIKTIPWQLYGTMSAGATRLELGRVLKVKCADTVTADNAL